MAGYNKKKPPDTVVQNVAVQMLIDKHRNPLIRYNWKELPIVFQRRQKTVVL
jgi:hypothetical protein